MLDWSLAASLDSGLGMFVDFAQANGGGVPDNELKGGSANLADDVQSEVMQCEY